MPAYLSRHNASTGWKKRRAHPDVRRFKEQAARLRAKRRHADAAEYEAKAAEVEERAKREWCEEVESTALEKELPMLMEKHSAIVAHATDKQKRLIEKHEADQVLQ